MDTCKRNLVMTFFLLGLPLAAQGQQPIGRALDLVVGEDNCSTKLGEPVKCGDYKLIYNEDASVMMTEKPNPTPIQAKYFEGKWEKDVQATTRTYHLEVTISGLLIAGQTDLNSVTYTARIFSDHSLVSEVKIQNESLGITTLTVPEAQTGGQTTRLLFQLSPPIPGGVSGGT